MQARRASRELALILFSQLNKNMDTYSKMEFEDIVLKSVRTLSNNALENLNITMGSLVEIKEFIQKYEDEADSNLQRPFDVSNLPVGIPLTSDMIGRIDEMLDVAEKSAAAIEIAELTALAGKEEVKNYVLQIAEEFQNNKEAVDTQIKNFAIGWDINRLVKIDKDILRIAITELLFIKNAPMKVVIDEALELAKKYSTDESSSFINGILGKVVQDNKVA